ncbi:hypothetical protein ACJRO7_022096 [Eucalyptus globulus]|uniref:Uncharacterized protein n=1 Tax=Eucalyptus globulus TaxID=34317 RepID=A0ABD3KTK3_EUCGL
MDIPAQILQYKNQIGMAVVGVLAISLMVYAAPRLVSILAYFWPLFASTAVFLVTVFAFGGISKLSTEGHSREAGEGIVDYVAGQSGYID